MMRLQAVSAAGALHRGARVRWRRRGGQIVKHAVLVLGSIIVLAPFVWFVSVALRPNDELYSLIPHQLTLSNFAKMTRLVPQMGSYFVDSIWITGATVVGVVVIANLAGYAFAWLRFPGRDVLFWMSVFTMFVPPVMALTSLYLELARFHLLDTRQGLILVYTSWHLAFGVFIMRNLFAGVPRDLVDAATVDGARMITILRRIMVPLTAGGSVIVALFTFVPVWGEFLFAYTLAGSKVQPMSVGIMNFKPNPADPFFSFAVAAAAGLLMFIPSVVIYLFLQRWFTRGLLAGAIKG